MNDRFNILNTIKAYRSICETENFVPLFSSIASMNNDDDDLLFFLVDLFIIITESDDISGLAQSFIDSKFSEFMDVGLTQLGNVVLNNKYANKTVGDLPINGGLINYNSIDFSGNLKNKNFNNLTTFEKTVYNSYINQDFLKLNNDVEVKLRNDNKLEYRFTNSSSSLSSIFKNLIQFSNVSVNNFFDIILEYLFGGKQSNRLKASLFKEIYKDEGFSQKSFTLEKFSTDLTLTEKQVIRNTSVCTDDGAEVQILDSEKDDLVSSQQNEFINNLSNLILDKTGNENTVKDSNRNILEIILNAVLDIFLFQPSSVFAILLSQSIDLPINKDFNNIFEYFDENSQIFECLISTIKELFYDFLIDNIEDALTEIVQCILIEFGKEKAEMYLQSIKSLLL